MTDQPDEAVNQNASDNTQHSAASEQAANGVDLKAENAELKDKLLRTMAEMENFRRRADREKADVMKYAVTAFAGDIVTVGDNLKRAIEAIQKEAGDNPAIRTLLEGVEVTERELIKVFERHGVTRFEPIGEKFDPHFHEAMLKIDVPNVAADTVVQVLQAGYKISERVLRPAAVVVAKGGTIAQPSAEPEAAKAAEADGEAAGGRAVPPAAKDEAGDPDVLRRTNGEPQKQAARKDRPGGDKRASTVTTPVTDGNTHNRDELISSFGKRLENGG
jgi:molecular chaperone GrpE